MGIELPAYELPRSLPETLRFDFRRRRRWRFGQFDYGDAMITGFS